MAHVTTPSGVAGADDAQAGVVSTPRNTTTQWPMELRTTDALSTRQILLSSDNWQSWEAAEDTLFNREMMRDTVERDLHLMIHGMARRVQKLSVASDDRTDYNVSQLPR